MARAHDQNEPIMTLTPSPPNRKQVCQRWRRLSASRAQPGSILLSYVFFSIPKRFVFHCLEASSQPTELKFTLGDPDDQKVAPQGLTKIHVHNSKLVKFDRFYKENWFLNYSRVWKMHERHLTCRVASFTDFKLHWKSLDIFSNWAPNEPWQSRFVAKYCFLLLFLIKTIKRYGSEVKIGKCHIVWDPAHHG